MRALLGNPGFRLLLIGQTLSQLGDRALIIAFGIWAKELTGSDAAAGVAFFFVAFPYLLAPFAGALIDRFSARGVFLVTNLSMAAVMLLTLLVRGPEQIWLLYLVILCYGLSGIVIGPTQATIVATIAREDELADANGLMQTVSGGVRLLAPLVGAGLFTLVGGHVVAMIDALTFVVAALCVLGVRVPARPGRSTAPAGWAAETAQGLRHVFGTPVLRDVVLALGLALLVMGFSQTLIFAIVDQGLHRPAAFVGVLSSVQGAGTIVAGLVTGWFTRRFGDIRLVTAGIAGIAAAALLYLVPHLAGVAAGALLFGAAICWTTAGLITTVQRRTPADLRGRALGTAMGAVSLPQTVSIALGAGLSLVLGYRALLILMIVITTACAGWLAWRVPATTGQAAEEGSLR
ncbi:MFS transporter [Catenuloplanes indicus]|uniref:MFS family permease n=1 Tax=Catenuloplanes indicus TaxID=137267 RepID=A0AAE3W0P2_9ACTN|nr:MFS transporter [Catenuloplanes indicus]MDQ0367254.1 MFS family permease [Catenuloplanes indicus]